MKNKKKNIFSILAIIFAFLSFPLGIIFGIISLIQIKRTGEEGKELAIAAIIIGTIILIGVLTVIFIWSGVRNFYFGNNYSPFNLTTRP